MNKRDLAQQLAAQRGLTNQSAERTINALMEIIAQALEQGERVQLMDFGTFLVRERAPRTSRNPRTGEPISVEGCRVPVFKAGKGLKDRIAAK